MTTLGKYEVLEKIGAGGYGVVFRGYDPFLKRAVAIKTCSLEDERVRLRFYREAEIAGNLIHPNITTVYDFGLHEGVPYLVEEYLTGEDLGAVIARGEPIPPARRLDYLVQVARGLEYAHSQGVVHRDIKPGNIRILDNGRAKIMDFGTAKLANVESQLTQAGMTLGTAAYISPEQIQGSDVGLVADLFSYGVTAYELLTYQRPFDGRKISTVLHQILHDPPRPVTELWPDCPPRLVQILARCLEKQPSRRYPRTGELVADLQEVIQEFSARRREQLATGDIALAGVETSGEASVAALLQEARGLHEGHELDRALLVAGEALAAAPDSREAAAIFSTLESDLREEIAQERRRSEIAAAAARVVAALESDDLVAAEQALAAAEAEHGTADALARARLRLEEAQRRRREGQVAELAGAAEAALDRDDLAAARDLAAQALALDPAHRGATATRAAAEQLLAQRSDRHRQQSEDAITSIRALVARGRLDEARQALAFARRLLGPVAAVSRLEAEIAEGEHRASERAALAARVDEARELLLVDAYDEALAILEEVERSDPSFPSIGARVRSAREAADRRREANRRAQAVSDAVIAIEGFIRRGDLQKAEEALQFALDRLGSFDEARRLLRVLAEARDRAASERRAAAAGAAAPPQPPAVPAPRPAAAPPPARPTAAEPRVERARRLMGEGEYGVAVPLLRAALEADPENVALEELLREAKAGRVRQQEEQRQAQAVEEAVAGVETCVRRGALAPARTALAAAIEQFGERPELLALRLRLGRLAAAAGDDDAGS